MSLELNRVAWLIGEILIEVSHRECNTWTNLNSRAPDAASCVLLFPLVDSLVLWSGGSKGAYAFMGITTGLCLLAGIVVY